MKYYASIWIWLGLILLTGLSMFWIGAAPPEARQPFAHGVEILGVTVTTQTNTTEKLLPECPTCKLVAEYSGSKSFFGQGGFIVTPQLGTLHTCPPVTSKVVTQQVYEVARLRFFWREKEWTVQDDLLVKTIVTEYQKTENWNSGTTTEVLPGPNDRKPMPLWFNQLSD